MSVSVSRAGRAQARQENKHLASIYRQYSNPSRTSSSKQINYCENSDSEDSDNEDSGSEAYASERSHDDQSEDEQDSGTEAYANEHSDDDQSEGEQSKNEHTENRLALAAEYEDADNDIEAIEKPVNFDEKKVKRKLDDTTDAIDKVAKKVKNMPQNSAAAVLFKSLPLEVHQKIIENIPNDRALVQYARICKKTSGAVSDSVLRSRWEETFDHVTEEDGTELQTRIIADRYRIRQYFFRKWIVFDIGKLGTRFLNNQLCETQGEYQKECIERLTDMILESNAYKTIDEQGDEVVVAKNMAYLQKLTSEAQASKVGSYLDILDALFAKDYTLQSRGSFDSEKNSKIMVIQICLAAIILHPDHCPSKVSNFDVSQKFVYSRGRDQALFSGRFKQEVNIEFVLHAINFFKFHLKAAGEGLLYHNFVDLEKDQLPQPWIGKIKPGTQELGSHWKGTYSWLSEAELETLRNSRTSMDHIISDVVDDGEGIHDMTFFFNDPNFNARNWPRAYENILNSDPSLIERDEGPENTQHRRVSPRKGGVQPKAKPVVKPEIKQFHGCSRGSSQNGHLFGRVHAINNQHDIHGWQRITIMKFFESRTGRYDSQNVWAYEGVVLPGGRMIVGRWRDALVGHDERLTCQSGPFIFWNVDKSPLNIPIEAEDALAFGQSIDDPALSLSFAGS